MKVRKIEKKVLPCDQAAQKEADCVAELQKKLLEERELEKIRRLEKDSGNGPTGEPVTQIDWIYEGPGASKAGAAVAE